ncbi:MAG: LysR family transcriptional regulator [Pseudomonadota bacterium]
MKSPPLTWLRAFEAVARWLSFTRAADELGLTQSAVSQHVRALEDHIGEALFVRAHRQLRLTEAGRLLLPDVTTGLSILSNATRRYGQVLDKPVLRIAASASVADHILAPNIRAFQALNPDLILEIRTTVWPDDFTATAADIEIRFGRAEMVSSGADLIEPSYLHLVAKPDVATAFVAGADVSLIQPVGLSTEWSDIAENHVPVLRVDTHGMAVNLAKAGAGVALTHGLISQPSLQSGDLVEIDRPRMPAKEAYYFAIAAAADQEICLGFQEWFERVIAKTKTRTRFIQ